MAHAPAKEKPIPPILPGQAAPDNGSLRAAPGVNPQGGIVFARARDHLHIVRLLEADPIPVVIMDPAALDDRSKGTIEEDSRATAAVQVEVLVACPVDGQTLYSGIFQVIAEIGRAHV